MGFFDRLFGRTPEKRAQQAEGEGNIERAVALWLEASKPAEAIAVLRRVASSEPDAWTRLEKERAVWRLAREQGVALESSGLTLAESLEAWVRRTNLMDKRDRAMLEEAAGVHLALERCEKAGDLYAEIGYHNRAAEAYTQGGLVRKLDHIHSREELNTSSARALRVALDELELAEASGDLLRAKAAAEDARVFGEGDPKVQEMVEAFLSRVLEGGRVELRFEGEVRLSLSLRAGARLTLGRSAESDVVLRFPGVSRAHAQLHEGQVRDLGSKHGTWVDGQVCKPAHELGPRGSLRLGERCSLRYESSEDGVRLLVGEGEERQFFWGRRWGGLGVSLLFDQGYWQLAPAGVTYQGRALTQPRMLMAGDLFSLSSGDSFRVLVG